LIAVPNDATVKAMQRVANGPTSKERHMPGNHDTAGDAGLTDRQRAIKEEFIRVRNTWAPQWESILRQDSDFLLAYLRLSAVPLQRNSLPDKVKELVYIAINASSTHLFTPGIQMHLSAALDFGATQAELMEVLELASTVGIHAANVAVPILLEVLNEEAQQEAPSAGLDDRQRALRQQLTAQQGYWDPSWAALLELDADLFEAYTNFAAIPLRSQVLDAKTKELVLLALDAAATHLYLPGIRTHMRNARRVGATAQEIMEVIEIVSVIGIHGALIGAPMLESLIASRAAGQR
jgi:alkylhydroperoxidase/carboxymuconolactone decarboxylase family protein YurZ